MTIIYVTEYNTKAYEVIFKINGFYRVRIYKDISDDNIYSVKPSEVFIGKIQVCDMTIFSGALDKSVFDGNTNFLKINEENNKYGYVYIGCDMVCTFLTNDKIYK